MQLLHRKLLYEQLVTAADMPKGNRLKFTSMNRKVHFKNGGKRFKRNSLKYSIMVLRQFMYFINIRSLFSSHFWKFKGQVPAPWPCPVVADRIMSGARLRGNDRMMRRKPESKGEQVYSFVRLTLWRTTRELIRAAMPKPSPRWHPSDLSLPTGFCLSIRSGHLLIPPH